MLQLRPVLPPQRHQEALQCMLQICLLVLMKRLYVTHSRIAVRLRLFDLEKIEIPGRLRDMHLWTLKRQRLRIRLWQWPAQRSWVELFALITQLEQVTPQDVLQDVLPDAPSLHLRRRKDANKCLLEICRLILMKIVCVVHSRIAVRLRLYDSEKIEKPENLRDLHIWNLKKQRLRIRLWQWLAQISWVELFAWTSQGKSEKALAEMEVEEAVEEEAEEGADLVEDEAVEGAEVEEEGDLVLGQRKVGLLPPFKEIKLPLID
mmetsp:Transcript_17158/g.24370  ORF Transcript_17158/g.24370 Transcript_17158/m.24370 type:complete len:262 (+) Transcript_17158:1051-1836(+)